MRTYLSFWIFFSYSLLISSPSALVPFTLRSCESTRHSLCRIFTVFLQNLPAKNNMSVHSWTDSCECWLGCEVTGRLDEQNWTSMIWFMQVWPMRRFEYRLLRLQFRLIKAEKDVIVWKQGSVLKKNFERKFLLLPKLTSWKIIKV